MHARDAEDLVRPLLWIGFDGRIPSPEAVQLIHRGVSGVILFVRNVGTRDETRTLIRELKAIAPGPLMLSVDQEGGRVTRLTEGFERFPSLREIGAQSPSEVREVGRRLGAQVRDAGFDIDLAPVVDVDSNPANPVIGERSFSRDPAVVASLGAAMIAGLEEHLAACAKHFPGHGDTDKDSHYDLPRLPHALDRLRACELVPFRAAVAAGVSCVMTTHVVFDALDPGVAATMSAPAIELLRNEVGFKGVCVSDCLEMKAISEHFGSGIAAVRAVAAGVDALLVCHTAEAQHEVIAHLAAAVVDGIIPERRIEEARGRLAALAARHARDV
ncbi:MAG: beta-N-acetylhexosaminidase [Planctomycetaceae bacterium]|nr:beta-N-acetylhexosaminidase [Planctomycetaceae bacterium]